MTFADRIIGLYQSQGLAWAHDREHKSQLETVWLDRFVALLPPCCSVLDLGCGSGSPVARYLIDAGLLVTGIDTSPPLLALCRQRFPNQEWRLEDMRALDLGRQFAGILAWNSFFHLTPDDQRRMFPIFRRHAAPGAPLMFTSGPTHGEAIGCYAGEPMYHASLDPAEYRALFQAHGFAERAHVAEDPQCHGHTVWLAQAV